MKDKDRQQDDIVKGSLRRVLVNASRTFKATRAEAGSRVLWMLVLSAVTAVIPLLDARLWALVIDTLQTGQAPHWLTWLVWAAIGLGLIVPIAFSVRHLFERRNWYSITRWFDLVIARKKTTLDLATYESKEAQNIFALHQQEGSWRAANFVNGLAFLAWAATSAVIAFATLLFELYRIAPEKTWLCALVFFATLPVLFTELWCGNELWGIHNARGFTKRRFWHLMGLFGGTSSLAEMKTHQSGSHFAGQVEGLFGRFEKEELGVEWKKLALGNAGQVLYQGIYAFVLFSLLNLAIAGRIQLGSFGFLLALVGTYRVSLSGFFSELGRVRDHERFVDNMWKLLDLRPALAWATEMRGNMTEQRDIVFDGVTAGYLDTDGNPFPVLRQLGLTIRQGERVAIVGPNGAGKSTLRKLLERHFDPSEGTVTLGGLDLREIDERTLYREITFLGQESMALNLTAREVIAAGYPLAPIDEVKVKLAADISGAASFIEDGRTMPNGYDDLIGKPDGCGLSGGQQRRLAIARAVYRLLMANPSVIVLDEATSQVDGEAAGELYSRLRELTQGKTVIVISHQLADIKEVADRIVVLEGGQIVEEGSHELLMAKRGVYFGLFHRQELDKAA